MTEREAATANVIELVDVERIVRLLAEVGDPTVDIATPERKRLLAEGVAQIIEADVWIWSTAFLDASHTDLMATCLLDGGWINADEQVRVYGAMTNQTINAAFEGMFKEVCSGKYLTRRRDEIFPADLWSTIREPWLSAGLEFNLFSLYPVGANVISGIGFHRRSGKDDFTERQRAIVHMIFQQVDWLHRHGTNEPASGKALQLSPRERQVLLFLLAGNSRKEIARKLELSEHTIGGYMKNLHRHFSVGSRAELQAYFMLGGR